MCPKIDCVSKNEHIIIHTNGVTIKICKKLFMKYHLTLHLFKVFNKLINNKLLGTT